MKKILFAGLVLMMFAPGLKSQDKFEYNKPNYVLPLANYEITSSDKIPVSVVKAMNVDFALDKPHTWTKFPNSLTAYGWKYDKNAADGGLIHYELKMRTTDGIDLTGYYSYMGILISTHEVFLNVELPALVEEKLAKIINRDWVVIGTMETIIYHHDKNSVEQHFSITIKKGKITRTISFNDEATEHNPKN
jgi:hypothetical protein